MPSSRTVWDTGRVIDVIWNKYPRMTELEVRSHLAKLGFRGRYGVQTLREHCPAASLARLRFAEIVLERPNLLFLDEPTNHLDIYTRENLTEALMAYTGTLLLVTHDRHLMNSLACPILYLEDGKAVLYPSYDALMGRTDPGAGRPEGGRARQDRLRQGTAPPPCRAARQDQGLRGRDGGLRCTRRWSWTTRSTPRRCTTTLTCCARRAMS
ncbi:MAG: hypothetical protein ACLT9S_03335 [Faecalibacterium sp.]